MIELAFSILAADFGNLAADVATAERGGGTIVHVDVMDGHFVPNISFGPMMVKALRPETKLPIDCHLMVQNPDRHIEAFAAAGADMLSIHQEVCPHLNRSLQSIADHNMLAGIVICPATPVEMILEVLPMVHHVLIMSVNPGFGGQKYMPRAAARIRHLVRLREEMSLNFRIEVDGGIAHDTVAEVVEAGADMLVAGSAIFQKGRTEENAREFLKTARAAATSRESSRSHGLKAS